MKGFVIVSFDVDCDGCGYSYHYFEGEEGTGDEALEYFALKNGCIPMGIERSCDVMSLTSFFCEMEGFPKWDKWGREYFIDEGYFSYFISNGYDDEYISTSDLDEIIHYEKLDVDMELTQILA